MKGFVFLSFCILFPFFTFSQDKHVEVKSAKDVLSIREQGKGKVFLPVGMEPKDVIDRAQYYTKYFTVNYNPSSGETIITMVENSERSRAIIRRFFVANDLRTVVVEGAQLDLETFQEKYLK